jgi:hypothetical protein
VGTRGFDADIADGCLGEALLTAGFESDAIIDAAVNPDMHWQRVPALLSRICQDVGLSDDIAVELPHRSRNAPLMQSVMIEEYRYGHRQAAELLHRFDDLRKKIGFPEPLELRICEDNDDGTNESGYYGLNSGRHGPEFHEEIRRYLANAGILAYPASW